MYPLCIFDVWYVEVFFLTPLIGLRIGKEGLITPPSQAAHKQKHTPHAKNIPLTLCHLFPRKAL
jgi:hypothetical protein